MNNHYRQQGFSLIEMLITMVTLGIIAAIAIPSYNHYVIQSRRNEAKIALLDLATRMEHYYFENNHSYLGASLTGLGITPITSHGYYSLAIVIPSVASYILQATPVAG